MPISLNLLRSNTTRLLVHARRTLPSRHIPARTHIHTHKQSSSIRNLSSTSASKMASSDPMSKEAIAKETAPEQMNEVKPTVDAAAAAGAAPAEGAEGGAAAQTKSAGTFLPNFPLIPSSPSTSHTNPPVSVCPCHDTIQCEQPKKPPRSPKSKPRPPPNLPARDRRLDPLGRERRRKRPRRRRRWRRFLSILRRRGRRKVCTVRMNIRREGSGNGFDEYCRTKLMTYRFES